METAAGAEGTSGTRGFAYMELQCSGEELPDAGPSGSKKTVSISCVVETTVDARLLMLLSLRHHQSRVPLFVHIGAYQPILRFFGFSNMDQYMPICFGPYLVHIGHTNMDAIWTNKCMYIFVHIYTYWTQTICAQYG